MTSAGATGELPRTGSRVRVVGLVGAIGSGKSHVAAELARRGARVVSGDELGHQALAVPALRSRITARWGTDLLDDKGQVVRARLGAIVFADPKERQVLEGIVHPWIRSRLEELLAQARSQSDAPLVVLDAAILLEAGWNDLCDALVYVHAPRRARLQRLARQRGWTEQEVDRRARAQWLLSRKASRADYVIANDGPADSLAGQVEELLGRLRGAPPKARRLNPVECCIPPN